MGGLLIVVGLFGVFAWPTLSLLGSIYAIEDDYSHGFMVPLISGYAAYQIQKETDGITLVSSWAGIPVLMLGVALAVTGYWYYIALLPPGLGVGFILAVGLLFSIAGLSISFGGASLLRIFGFPIVYLIFAIPFPKSFTLPFTLWLRNIVTILSESAIRTLGITVFREGNVLHLTNGMLGVADACSGIRSFWILMAGAAAIAFVLRVGCPRTLLLCFLAIPISVTLNLLRIVVTATLVSKIGVEFASGWRHDVWGWMTFIGGLVVIVYLAFIFAKNSHKERQITPPTRDRGFHPVNNSVTLKRVTLTAVVGLLFGCGAFANYFIGYHYDSVDIERFEKRKPLGDLPKRIGNFVKIADGKVLPEHLEYLSPIDHVIRHYETVDNHGVELRIFYWSPLKFRRFEHREGVGSHIPDVCFPSWGFERIDEFDRELEFSEVGLSNVNVRLFRKENNEKCVLFWYNGKTGENVLPKGQFALRGQKLLHSWNEPILHHGVQYIVTVIADIKTTRPAAENAAIQFVRDISPILPEFGIEYTE